MTLKSKLHDLYLRSNFILKQEGFLPLLTRGFVFFSEYFLHFGTFFLFEDTPDKEDSVYNIPPFDDISVQIISTSEHADRLAAAGFDIRAITISAKEKLDKGAIAFCIFVGEEFAHIGWLAMSQHAKDAFGPYPYHVDFLNAEACIVHGMTLPKYRSKGITVYSKYLRLKYLGEKGIVIVRSIGDIRNTAIQRVADKIGARRYAKGRYVKIFCWYSWKETPLE
jgi:hypothetical protein